MCAQSVSSVFAYIVALVYMRIVIEQDKVLLATSVKTHL